MKAGNLGIKRSSEREGYIRGEQIQGVIDVLTLVKFGIAPCQSVR